MTTVLFVQGGAERAGAERVLMSILRHVDRSQVRMVVAFLADGPFVDEVREAGVEVRMLPSAGRLRDLARVPAAVRALRALIDELDPDVVQATGEKMSVYAGLACRASATPCVFWLHDSPWGPRTHGPGTLATQAAMAATPHAAVVSCARWLADEFARRYRMPGVAIPNGIELDRLPPADEVAATRDALLDAAGWDPDAVVLGHFARLQKWKGTDVFLRAGADVIARHPDTRLAVVGGAMFGQDEQWAAGLPALARELGIAEQVHFTGYRSDAMALMAAVDGVVHSSLRLDPFPTVVLEGMVLGRPVVATKVRGPEESLEHGVTGMLAEPGDVASLAAAMAEVASSPERRHELGDAARATALARYDARRMAADFESFWRELVEGRYAPTAVGSRS